MNTNELSHAAQCLEIYVRNDREIYERYTMPSVRRLVKLQAPETFTMWHVMQGVVIDWDAVDNAMSAAARIVRKYDHISPTAEDIETVKAGYVSDIIDKARNEIMRDKREKLDGLKFELQQYYDNASHGLLETRRRNMVLLRWDIRKLEGELQNA